MWRTTFVRLQDTAVAADIVADGIESNEDCPSRELAAAPTAINRQ